MGWFSKKKENPDRRAFREEFKESIQLLNRADRIARMAVGHSINMANSALYHTFGSVEGFKEISKAEQMAYINKLTELEAKLQNEDPMSGIGVGLYKMWLATVVENDEELINLFSGELQKFSNEGDLPA